MSVQAYELPQTKTKVKGQSWDFTSCSTDRVILGQVLIIVTSASRTHIEVTACD